MAMAFIGAAAQGTVYTKAEALQSAAKAIADDPAFSEAVLSFCAKTGDGKTLVDIDADNMVMPASNKKTHFYRSGSAYARKRLQIQDIHRL